MNKENLIELVKELLKEEDLSSRSDDLLFLKRQYKSLSLRDEESFYEQQLTNTFNSLFEELAKKDPKLMQSSSDEKKEIIRLAKELLKREDILKATKDMDSYSEAFRKAGRSSKELDDALYEEFKAVKDEFYSKKREYIDTINKTYAERKAQKEALIEKAKQLLDIKNIKESNEKMDALIEEWKTIGFSGKDNDQEMWSKFCEVRKDFHSKKKEHHNEMIKLFEERAAKKEEMIKDAKKILADSDFSEEEVKKVKEMRNEFNKIGFAGKEKDDDLYQRFDEVIKKYFDEKKFYTF